MQVECDVLAGEQGPSCKTLDQIPNLKLIHVRFVGTSMKYATSAAHVDVDSFSKDSVSPPTRKKRYEPPDSRTSCYSSEILARQTKSLEGHTKDKTAIAYPKSLSVTQMLNLGKVVQRKSSVVEIFKFNLENMTWSAIPEKVEFEIEKEPFAKGGFREVFKAKSPTKEYNECTWVVKRYLPNTLQCIKDLGQTVEEHTKKTVQMQSLAQNIAESLCARVNEVCKDEFGQLFVYTDIFMAKLIELEEYITVEKFIDGDFRKYINNTGSVCGESTSDICKKAECLTHYSYEKSSQQLMLLDLQGSKYTLFDPEIASVSLCANKEFLFGAGNLTFQAIKSFIQNHVCNKFCTCVGLKTLSLIDVHSSEEN